MRNHYYRSVALGLLCQSLIATSSVASTFAQEVQEKFISSGITERTGGYRPIRADMTDNDKGITKKPDGLQQPRYGRIQLQLESWAFILDEPEDAPAKLYIDANRDGDLTNDPAVEWEP